MVMADDGAPSVDRYAAGSRDDIGRALTNYQP